MKNLLNKINAPLIEVDPNNLTYYKSNKLILDSLNKYNDILLIGQVQSGKTQHIINLTLDALKKYNYNKVICLCGTKTNLLDQTKGRFNKELAVYEIKDLENLYNKNCCICVLKEKTNLEKLNNWLKDVNGNLLIIDDECDNSSLNIKKTEESRIFSLINEIVRNNKIIRVTATPYANLLNSHCSIQKIFYLPTNTEYTGLLFFNQLDDFYVTNILNDKKDKKLILKQSLIIFLTSTFLLFKNTHNKESQFLINYNQENIVQDEIKKIIEDLIKDWEFKKELYESLDDYNIDKTEFKNWLSTAIHQKDIIVYTLNKDNPDIGRDERIEIIVGGHLMSRGNTFEHVTTALLNREDSEIDSLLQKCRWFGYRRKNDRYKYMKLITTPNIKNIFKRSEKLINALYPTITGGELDYQILVNILKEYDETFSKGLTNNAKKQF